MLSQEDKKKQPMGKISHGDDLMSSAKVSATNRLISAIQSSDASQALDALTDLLELLDQD